MFARLVLLVAALASVAACDCDADDPSVDTAPPETTAEGIYAMYHVLFSHFIRHTLFGSSFP